MLFVKAPIAVAEPIRKKLIAEDLFDPSHEVEQSKQFIYFPVKRKASGFDFIERKGNKRHMKPKSLKEALRGKLPDEDLEKLVTSFDILGDIAIIEVRHGLDEKLIGEAILESNPSVKTVLKKAGAHEGEFRIVPVKCIAGLDKTETIYREHGVRMKLKMGQVYFSPRLSQERHRIAELVKPGEKIAGFFAGAGPFPLIIAKKTKCTIYAVELNPRGYEMMKENIKLNKLKGEIIPLLGDVREIAQTIPQCDRVLMPAPKNADTFLIPCMLAAKKGAMMHYYEFAPDLDPYSDAIRKIEKAAASLGRKVKIMNKRIVRPHAVRFSQVAIDFEIY